MEDYFKFSRKALAILGVNLDRPNKKFETLLQILTFTTIVVAALQSLLFIIKNTEIGMPLANAVTVGLFDLQGCVKLFVLLTNQSKLKAIRDLLTVRIKLLTQEQLKKNQIYLDRFQNCTRIIILTNLICIWIFNVLPFITFLYFYIARGALVQLTPFSFWYPFNKTEWYFPVYLYEIACGQALTATPLIVDALILLMVGQLIVLFKCLGDTFRQIIDDFEVGKREETVKRLAKAIDSHNILFDLSADLLGIYEIPLLVNVLTQTGSICFIAFIVSTQGMDIVIPSLLGLANTLAQVFLICWFGEQMKGSSLRVRKKIMESNYHLLDPSLQKTLIMVILRSQRAKVMKASKFFALTHLGFTSIVRGAMSYFTLVKHLYKSKGAEYYYLQDRI